MLFSSVKCSVAVCAYFLLCASAKEGNNFKDKHESFWKWADDS